ncbi:polyol transporter 5-like [Lolium rigidum]|uniref:polyol transporter 5-like n=1 Tax=Lolium rigidum TaxID=89674 RepID=UPI001F5C1ECA|nr:polyol transporter 5-like [Lolium rigidum]
MAKATRRPVSVNKYAVATAVLSTATPLFLGYDLAMVSSTAVLAEADLKLLACTVVVSSLTGALAAVGAQRLIGDRRTVLLSAALLCAGALARGLAVDLAAFTCGIFVNGVGMGLALMIVPAYAVELSPSSLRGALTSHPDGLVYLGCILGSLYYSTGLLRLPAHLAWRVTVASGTAIPALLGCAVLLMPESPRWLLAKDQVAEARRVLSRTSATLEEAELRLLEIKAELGTPHDVCEEAVKASGTRSRWKEERATWRKLAARPTEPLRRAVVSALVAKVFQQASGIGSMSQYVQRAFRDVGVASGRQMPRALVAFGLVVVGSFSVSLVLVELGLMLVTALAGGCTRRAPLHSPVHRSGMMTRRQEQLKRSRGMSATMLFSLMALVWIALGPVHWADAPSLSRGGGCCPRWLRAAAAAVNRTVSAAILSSFAWVYGATSVTVQGSLLVCSAVGVLVWLSLCACLLGAKRRR